MSKLVNNESSSGSAGQFTTNNQNDVSPLQSMQRPLPINGVPLHESSNASSGSNAAPPYEGNVAVQEQGVQVHGATATNTVNVILPTKRSSSDLSSGKFQVGESSNSEQPALAKQRLTESQVSANNNVIIPSVSPPLPHQMQHFSETAHTEQPFQGYHHDHDHVNPPPTPPQRPVPVHIFESRRWLSFQVQSVFGDLLHSGNPLLIEIVRFTRLSGEAIMKHIKCETFVSVEKDDPKEEERCSICLEEYEDGERIGKLDLCVHKFHVDCIKQWIMQRNECPICRQIALTVKNVGK